MKVLLISPLPKIDPPCGDVIYTQNLLSHPPQGVEYETYADALKRGTLVEHGNRHALQNVRRKHINFVGEISLTVASHLLNRLRKAHLLFWEPYRFFSVKPGRYDLVHLNVFSARFLKLDCPLVVSNATPLRYLYTKGRMYSERRVAVLERIEIVLGRLFGMNVNSYSLPQATRLITFTSYLKKWYVERGIMPSEKVDVVPIFLPSGGNVNISPHPKRIGFIAREFEAKGGQTLLRAFEKVRGRRPDTELIIVGSVPQLTETEMQERGIAWLPYVERSELLKTILPSFDVFAYPTGFDGLPLVVLEALSFGVPVATSDYQAMPEVVDGGNAGLISPVGDAEILADNILCLLAPSVNAHYSMAGKNWFDAHYSSDSVGTQLHSSYQEAIRSYTLAGGSQIA